METIVQIAQLLLALSILVGIHEAGHMISARMFGMRVEKFFIGFPPRIFSFKKGDTEYGLGAVPLGGFVKISGMIDESMDKEQMSQEPKPWEFRSKPAWQRLIVMLGGIIVNVVAGITAFVILTYNVGDLYTSSDVVKENGIVAHKYGEIIGFQTGDKVIRVNGEDYARFSDISSAGVFLTSGGYYTVTRDGQTLDIEIPRGFLNYLSEDDFVGNFISIQTPFEIGKFSKNSNAEKAGLEIGDRITQVGGQPIQYYHEMKPALALYAGQSVEITFVREAGEASERTENVLVAVNPDTTIGFYSNPLYEISKREYSFGEALSRGSGRAINSVVINAKALGKMFTGEVSARSLSGPIGIVNLFPKTWDWNQFWYITGFISMILAFMNLLPIPALDGGHVVFLLFEIISGKTPSDKFLENAQKVGMVILLALMVFVFGNDILKLFGI